MPLSLIGERENVVVKKKGVKMRNYNIDSNLIFGELEILNVFFNITIKKRFL